MEEGKKLLGKIEAKRLRKEIYDDLLKQFIDQAIKEVRKSSGQIVNESLILRCLGVNQLNFDEIDLKHTVMREVDVDGIYLEFRGINYRRKQAHQFTENESYPEYFCKGCDHAAYCRSEDQLRYSGRGQCGYSTDGGRNTINSTDDDGDRIVIMTNRDHTRIEK